MTAPLLTQLERAKNGLEDAQIAYCNAVTAHAEAKRGLELAEAVKLCEGVEGKNETQRDAKLRLELQNEYTALAEAEDALTEARCALDVARLEWDLARCQLRDINPSQAVEDAVDGVQQGVDGLNNAVQNFGEGNGEEGAENGGEDEDGEN